MKLNSVVIRTKDIQKSIEFYERVLKFEFLSMMSAAPGKQIAFLREPESGMNLELIYNENAAERTETRMSLTIQVEQIGEAEKYLREHKAPAYGKRRQENPNRCRSERCRFGLYRV